MFTPVATRRVPQIYEKPQFYVGSAGYSDIIQGKCNVRSFLNSI